MTLIATWLLTIAVHGGVLLLVAWAIDQAVRLRCAWRELLWRTALFGCVLSATLQLAAVHLPLAERWSAVADSANSLASSAEPEQQIVHGNAAPLAESRLLSTTSSASYAQTPAGVSSAAPARPLHTLSLPSSVRLLTGIVSIWLLGVLFAIGRFILACVRLRRSLAGAVVLADPACARDLSLLAQQAGIAEPRLQTLDAIPSPIAAPFARIVLPTWAIQRLDQSHCRRCWRTNWRISPAAIRHGNC